MPYTLRHGLPQMIERAKMQTVRASVYLDGQAVTPDSGTYTLLDSNGDTVTSGAVVASGTDATYSVGAASVPVTLLPRDDWQERWTLTLAGVEQTFHRAAYLVLRVLYPVITDADLTARHTELLKIKSRYNSSFQPYLDFEWESMQRRLIAQGKRPQLILDAFAVTDYHIFRTLHAIFTDAYTSSGGQYAALSAYYAEEAEKSWNRLQFRYDTNEDNNIDGSDMRSGPSAIWIGGAPVRSNTFYTRWGNG